MKTSVRFFGILMAAILVFTFCAAFAESDTYSARDERYPDRHWVYMSQDEIDYYEGIGWQRYVGVLWYDTNDDNSYVDFFEIGDCQELINEGYVFHVIYTWVCPGEKLGKYTEQTVSAGYWQLNAEQAQAYHATYEIPELNISESEKTGVLYESNWAYDGAFAGDPEEGMDEETLGKYTFVRVAYSDYNRGYGQDIVLLNGDYQEFSLEQAVEIGGFDAEIPRWN